MSHDDPDAVRRLGSLPLPLIWLDPRVWRQYAKLLLAGERMRRCGGDERQLGGDFVVDSDGVIVYARSQRRDDRHRSASCSR